MITVARVNVSGDEKPLEIRACSEIQDMVSEISYLESNAYLSCLKTSFGMTPKIVYKNIFVNFPKDGKMFVGTGKGMKVFHGKPEELMAIYILANQYQRGENSCKYCKRTDSRCQIKGFLDEVDAVAAGMRV